MASSKVEYIDHNKLVGRLNLNGTNDNGTGALQVTGTVFFFAMPNYASDALAAAGGVAIGQLYRNGSVVQVRVT